MCPKIIFFKNLVRVLEMAFWSIFGENIVKELKGLRTFRSNLKTFNAQNLTPEALKTHIGLLAIFLVHTIPS